MISLKHHWFSCDFFEESLIFQWFLWKIIGCSMISLKNHWLFQKIFYGFHGQRNPGKSYEKYWNIIKYVKNGPRHATQGLSVKPTFLDFCTQNHIWNMKTHQTQGLSVTVSILPQYNRIWRPLILDRPVMVCLIYVWESALV